MSGKPKSFRDAKPDVLALLGELARAPSRDASVASRPGTRGEALGFRQRLYAWRRAMLNELSFLSSHSPAEAARGAVAQEWLQAQLGPRATKAWLDLTTFAAEGALISDFWIVRARLARPMAGPDLTFADAPSGEAAAEHARSLRLLAAASRSKGPPT